jgi:hypothetical protein
MKWLLCILLASMTAWAQAIPIGNLEIQGLDAAVVTFQGKEATRLADREGGGMALLKGSDFKNGAIEVELAGRPSAGSFAGARGFVGIAFRWAWDRSSLRQSEGNADALSDSSGHSMLCYATFSGLICARWPRALLPRLYEGRIRAEVQARIQPRSPDTEPTGAPYRP